MTIKKVYLVAVSAVVGTLVFGVGSATAAEQRCAPTETYSWTGGARLLPWEPTFDTGIAIPPPAPGETLRVVEAGWSAYDEYPADGSAGTRIAAGQVHESFGITIGGVAFGGITTDVPNGPDEGAPTEYFSGVVNGSFGTGPTEGGPVLVRHSSLYGFTESTNSVIAAGVHLVVERCTTVEESVETTQPPVDTTQPPVDTTQPPVETTQPPVDTTQPPVETTQPPVETTQPPVETTQPPVDTTVRPRSRVASRVAVPLDAGDVLLLSGTNERQELPATGTETGLFVLVGSLLTISGLGLTLARRRPS